MNAYQIVVDKMILEIILDFKENTQLLDGDPVLKAHVEKLFALEEQLNANKLIQENDISGVYIDKMKAKDELAELIFPLSGAVRSFAIDNNDKLLFNEVKLSLSRLKHIGDIKFVNYSSKFTNICTEKIDLLGDYHVSAKEIEEIVKKTKEYQKLMLLPAKMRKEKSVASDNITMILSEMLSVLRESIDNDMLAYAGTETYKKYAKLREIDDSRTRHLPFFGFVFDEITKLALQFVAVTIVRFKAGADLANTVKITTKLGNYQFKDLKPGVYKVTFSLYGYDTLEVIIAIHKGESKRFDVGLRVTE